MKAKRTFAVLLALVMAFSFAACGGEKKVTQRLKRATVVPVYLMRQLYV